LKPTQQSSPFAGQLLAWFDHCRRRDLPWQHDRNLYRVWVSEVMLQQTQVTTVVSYFERFMHQFPDLPALAAAELDQVMALWEGLGYYSRARNLHTTSRQCVRQYAGALPNELEQLCALPGIGRSTAGAIVSLALDQPATILDGNLKRVLTRYHALPGWPGRTAVNSELWRLAESHLPASRGADYSQASMDLGALICLPKSPDCQVCPVNAGCQAFAQGSQEKFPEKKKPVQRPERQCVLLILVDQGGRLLLEKRPARGIWGGLWSLPMFDSIEQAERSMGRLDSRQHGAPFVHAFTHFLLHAEPILSQYKAANPGIRDAPDGRWVDAGQASMLGLPKPIRMLVSDFFAGQTSWQEQSTA
jgi:A/G-specific adenine glycosylase